MLIAFIAIPLLVIYIIGFPTVVYCKMKKEVKERNKKKKGVLRFLGCFLSGLRKNNISGKSLSIVLESYLLIVASCTFLAHTNHENKIVLGLLVLFLQTKLVRRL